MEANRGVFKRVGPYDLSTTLGQGSFAMVYRGQHRESNRSLAVKAIVRARLNQKLQQNLEAEITILQTLQHPNIVRLHDVQTTERHVYLIMELCPGGDLMRVIRSKGAQTEAQTRYYLRQLAQGLRYLRDHYLVHRDLKPQNLLLSSTMPDAVLKIADFGFARYMQQADMAETLCGSPLYMAPEILRFQKYDAKADLWSVGTIVYELLTAHPPFTGANHVQLLKQIEEKEVELPAHLSPSCCALLLSLLRREATERLSFEQFFAHPFLCSDSPEQHPHPAISSAATAVVSEPPLVSTAGLADVHAPPRQAVMEPADAPPGGNQPLNVPISERLSAQAPSPMQLPAASVVPSPKPALHPNLPAQPRTECQSSLAIPNPSDAPFATFNHKPPVPRKSRSPTAALLASSPPNGAQISPALPSCIPELALPASPVACAPAPAGTPISLSPSPSTQQRGRVVAMPSASQGQLVATRRQVVPVTVAATSASPNSHPTTCIVSGLGGVSPSSVAHDALAVYDKSLDGLDNEYVLVSQSPTARAVAFAQQRDRRGAAELHQRAIDAGQRGMLQLRQKLPDEQLPCGAIQPESAVIGDGESVGEDRCISQVGSSQRMPLTGHYMQQHDLLRKEQQHRQQLLAGRAFAVAELAQQSAEGGLAPHGESFSMVESLALHVKALDLTQQAMQLAQADKQDDPIVVVGAINEANSHADVLRARFATLLESAEWIREQLRCEQILRNTPTVCVEELLYRHALAMGREAAVDEMVGKLNTSRALYQRAKLLLEQLAEEPQVGHADRAVLSKYAAGFAWRLQEIAMKEDARGTQ